MPRRMSTLTRAYVYAFLVLRDGPDCRLCHTPPTTPAGHDVDHLDNDSHNWAPSNLRLLCRSCNVARENTRRGQARLHETPDSIPSDPTCERAITARNRAVGTELARETLDYQAGSAEMRANDLYEMPYRAWVLDQVRERGFLTVQTAMASGAELVGCSTVTAARYLAKLTSEAGPLQETRDMLRARVLTIKEPIDVEQKTGSPVPPPADTNTQQQEGTATEQGEEPTSPKANTPPDEPTPCLWNNEPHHHEGTAERCVPQEVTYHPLIEGP